MSSKKITVIGIGGIGGALAAPLIQRYGEDVTLIARGKRLEQLLKDGLKVKSRAMGDREIFPVKVQEDPGTLPEQDYILICVKTGGLAKVCEQIRPAVGRDTVLIPVMNGVDAYPMLLKEFPGHTVLPCAIYVISELEPDGTVEQQSKYINMYAGISPDRKTAPEADRRAAEKAAAAFCGVMQDAGFSCKLVDDAASAVWMKYVLNCGYNVMTGRYLCTIGEVIADEERLKEYRKLLQEALDVGIAAGNVFPEDFVDKQIDRAYHTAPDATSSLKRDLAAGRMGELDIFSGTIIRMGKELGVPVPVTEEYDRAIRAMMKPEGDHA